jgi:4-amino-4-deoxy-L-arabinose transferase-like glycosyltransferase
MDRFAEALKTRLGAALLALVLALALVLPGQSTIPPIDRDEARFAQASRQMLETGDYVDIRFLDAPRYLQPAGIYWLQAASVQAFGETDARAIWPHRVPSWISAIATIFLTWWIGGLLFGRDAGRIAALMMGACLILNVEARIAKIDSTLCAVTLLAQAMLAKAYVGRESGEKLSPWQAALFWTATGFGILLKGPVMLLATGGTIVALVALDRRARWLGALRPLWGAPLMIAVAAPWYAAIYQATNGEFFRVALGYSVAGKVAGAHQNHGGPIGYHAILFTGMFWPASFFAWLAAPFAWLARKQPAVRFCIAWIVPAWIVFEISGTKLPHYTLPLLPAVAMLAAAALLDARSQRWMGRPRLFVVAAIFWLVFTLVLTVGVPAVRLELERDAAFGGLLVGIVALLAGLVMLALAAQGRTRAALAAMTATAALAWVNAFGITLPAMRSVFMAPRVMALVNDAKPCPTSRLALLEYHEPSLVFLSGSATMLAQTPEELAAYLKGDPACRIGLVGEPKRTALLAAAAAQGLTLAELGVIEGFNHNEGEENRLTLFQVAR